MALTDFHYDFLQPAGDGGKKLPITSPIAAQMRAAIGAIGSENTTFSGTTRMNVLFSGAPTDPGDTRVRYLSLNPTANAFNAQIVKTAGDVADANMMGAALAHHAHSYAGTPGYGGVSQWYSLAGGHGAALGCNTFTNLNTAVPYAIPPNPEANGHVRIEVGPSWPRSEAARWNNGGDYLQNFTNVIAFAASQSGTTVTAPSAPFLPVCVGNYVAWSDTTAGGPVSCVDRIVDYISPTQVTVERSRTIASQTARYGYYATEARADRMLRQTGADPQFCQDAHSGGDSGGFRTRRATRGVVTVDDTPAVLTGPQVIGDYVQLWEIKVVGLASNMDDYCIFQRTVQTVRDGGSHQIGTPVVVGTDVNPGSAFSIALGFASGALTVTVEGPDGVNTTWAVKLECTEAVYIP